MTLTDEQVDELLNLPSGQRPRIYATITSGPSQGQRVKVTSHQQLDEVSQITGADPTPLRQRIGQYWMSDTTIADLVRPA